MTTTGKVPLADFATRLDEIATELRDRSPLLDASYHEPPSILPREGPLDRIAQVVLEQLHMRKRFLPPSLFHEPAWEILLALFVSERDKQTLNVKQLVSLIDAPPTTSQRWIDQLVHMKLLQRKVDVNDRRRLEISLSETGFQSVERYLHWIATNTDRKPPTV